MISLSYKLNMPKAAKTVPHPVDPSTCSEAPSRRRFLIQGAGTGLIGAVSGLAGASHASAAPRQAQPEGYAASQGIHAPMTHDSRSTLDLTRRTEMCRGYANAAQLAPRQTDCGDEQRYRAQRYIASFTKTLPCNEFGEVDPPAFEALVKAMEGKNKSDFDAIPLAANATRKLANPQGALKFQSCGPDGQQSRMPPSHRFSSAALAGEMVEVYWQALTRDVPYTDYSEHRDIYEAAADLNQLSETPARTSHLFTTPKSLFRGESEGDLVGPYLSQFLWQDYHLGPKRIDQRYPEPITGRDFMTDIPNWLSVQRGTPRGRSTFTGQSRYIYNNRTLAEFVHADAPFQAYLQAGLILLGYGRGALASSDPYHLSFNQGAFVSHGAPFILDLVTRAAQAALHAAWYQKWCVHRFLRPEAMAARVHFHREGQRNYEIHSDLLNSLALDRTYDRQRSYLLSQAYPEGSPTHPSYPAGHACIAGACVTILKALFAEDYVIQSPVVANRDGTELLDYQGDTLRIGGELNKLASNMSLGRDAAGVHYRQDGIEGLLVGEQVAIALLQEQSTSFFESSFNGYLFRSFNNTVVEIRDGQVLGS